MAILNNVAQTFGTLVSGTIWRMLSHSAFMGAAGVRRLQILVQMSASLTLLGTFQVLNTPMLCLDFWFGVRFAKGKEKNRETLWKMKYKVIALSFWLGKENDLFVKQHFHLILMTSKWHCKSISISVLLFFFFLFPKQNSLKTLRNSLMDEFQEIYVGREFVSLSTSQGLMKTEGLY